MLLAIVYVLGGENESFTHNTKLMADIQYIQENYCFLGGLIPDVKVKNKFREYVKEIEKNDKPPKWAKYLMKNMYNIEIY